MKIRLNHLMRDCSGQFISSITIYGEMWSGKSSAGYLKSAIQLKVLCSGQNNICFCNPEQTGMEAIRLYVTENHPKG